MSEESLTLPQEHKLEMNKSTDVVSEEDYFSDVTEYALSVGWVKENKKNVLIERYLQPIYDEYFGAVSYLRENNTDGETMAKVTRRLNQCLYATRRIGSTDANNILMEIEDIRNNSKTNEEEFAVTAIYERLVKAFSEEN